MLRLNERIIYTTKNREGIILYEVKVFAIDETGLLIITPVKNYKGFGLGEFRPVSLDALRNEVECIAKAPHLHEIIDNQILIKK